MSESSSKEEAMQIVIVGAGMAGLTCARDLLWTCPLPLRVLLVEASDAVGGRVRKLPANNNGSDYYLDAGAELIHGRGHILWDTIREYQRRGLLPATDDDNDDDQPAVPCEFPGLEPHFILAHADGGPEQSPTPQGKYGMYFIDGELVMYNDEKVQPLVDVMEAVLDSSKWNDYTDDTSLADALVSISDDIPRLSDSLLELCVAGYGNTAGCCDLAQLSIRQLMAFEHYWETNEIEGDYRPLFGMHKVVDVMIHELKDSTQYNNKQSIFQRRLNTPVERVQEIKGKKEVAAESAETQSSGGKIRVSFADDCSPTVLADAVVVTVPPTRLLQLFDNGRDMPTHKRQALQRIGFADRVVKICCNFQTDAFWPKNLQSIVAAKQDIPEIWFRKLPGKNCYAAIGYLVSSAANQLVDRIREMQTKATLVGRSASRERFACQILLEQLSVMFKVPLQDLQAACLEDETQLVDWKDDFPFIQGGYMYPKVGMKTTEDLGVLAEPIMDGRVFFAGEATNTNACCTVQAAMETGVRASKEIQGQLLSQKKAM